MQAEGSRVSQVAEALGKLLIPGDDTPGIARVSPLLRRKLILGPLPPSRFKIRARSWLAAEANAGSMVLAGGAAREPQHAGALLEASPHAALGLARTGVTSVLCLREDCRIA